MADTRIHNSKISGNEVAVFQSPRFILLSHLLLYILLACFWGCFYSQGGASLFITGFILFIFSITISNVWNALFNKESLILWKANKEGLTLRSPTSGLRAVDWSQVQNIVLVDLIRDQSEYDSDKDTIFFILHKSLEPQGVVEKSLPSLDASESLYIATNVLHERYCGIDRDELQKLLQRITPSHVLISTQPQLTTSSKSALLKSPS